MYQIMITSMIAINVHKIDIAGIPTEYREKEYIPAPWQVPRGTGTEPLDHLPYSPVITCIDIVRYTEAPIDVLLCEQLRPGWLKI